MAKRDLDMAEETEEEEKEATKEGFREKEEPKGERKRGGATKRARGGAFDAATEHKHALPKHQHHHGRKRGGKVPGMEAKERPDRRARGGGTSDKSPLTSAGNMSVPDYEGKDAVPNGGGRGTDSSPYGHGSHRRPG